LGKNKKVDDIRSVFVTRDMLCEVIKQSISYSEALENLHIPFSKNNKRKLGYLVKKFGICTDHMNIYCFKPGFSPKNKRPLNSLLVLNPGKNISGPTLKERLIKERFFKRECSDCKNVEWQGKPIPLQIEHINGNPDDYRIGNLKIICPNCHALTPTYCGKNTKRHKDKLSRVNKKKEKDAIDKERRKIRKNIESSIKNNKRIKKGLISKKIYEYRMNSIKSLDTNKYGWVSHLSKEWGISHTTVRRYVKRHMPELYEKEKSQICDVSIF